MSPALQSFSNYHDPDWSDLLIDALHLAIADKVEKNPRLLSIPLHNLSVWRRKHPDQRQAVRQWKLIVYTWDFPEILALLRDPAPHAKILRRSSPFCGVLTASEIAMACTSVITGEAPVKG